MIVKLDEIPGIRRFVSHNATIAETYLIVTLLLLHHATMLVGNACLVSFSLMMLLVE